MQYALRLAKIEGFKAEERMKSGKADPCQMFGKGVRTDEVVAETKHYKSEDDVIKDLLETNIRQRGNVGGSDLKLGRRIAELSRIYDIKNGRPEKTTNNVQSFTQEDLAKQLGISVRTLQNAKSLTTLPQEIQDLIEQGRFLFWESACYFRSLNPKTEFHAAVSSKNNCSKMLKNAIIKGFFGILKFHRMASGFLLKMP